MITTCHACLYTAVSCCCCCCRHRCHYIIDFPSSLLLHLPLTNEYRAARLSSFGRKSRCSPCRWRKQPAWGRRGHRRRNKRASHEGFSGMSSAATRHSRLRGKFGRPWDATHQIFQPSVHPLPHVAAHNLRMQQRRLPMVLDICQGCWTHLLQGCCGKFVLCTPHFLCDSHI